ncbi:hypothetical protein ACRALDRAFT_1076176 [Sodiomyces alcalophilus JCM 7366]|uniref:uncharacterized protein n=1 Tax=Sodiomyces alcalophilus JCM 7366 TaxID=591952 RepID=UPI0039B3E0F3
MLVAKVEEPHLKAWLMNKLPEVSDTETDILAEYVVALLASQEGDASQIRAGCESELPPFLNPDATPKFVDDLFRAIESKSFLPPELRPAPSKKSLESQQSPSQASSSLAEGNRKRPYHERENMGPAYAPSPGERAFKQPRRGGGFGRGIGATDANDAHASQNYDPRDAFPPTGFSHPLDMIQLGSFNGLPAATAPGLPQQPPPFPSGPQSRPYGTPPTARKRRQRCRDFDTKGFCARGNSCQFDHGMGPIYLPSDPMGRPDDYSTTGMAAALLSQNFQQLQQLWETVNAEKGDGGGGRGRGGRNQGPRRRQRRASISAEGPVHDQTKSTIVVENIPEDKFSEEAVREFFSQFGNILELSLQPRRRLAIIKYDSWSAANAAYRSPKVIFDNRFVKVFWYKEDTSPRGAPDSNGMDGASGEGNASAGPEFDMDEFLKKQQEAQRLHEEKMQKKEELQKEREALEARQRELMERQLEEKRKLQAKLRGSQNGDDASGSQSNSDALRAQLAALEEEAKLLGLDPHADDASSHGGGGSVHGGVYRGRGRGRGGFPPRGRGSFRAGYRGGRGGFGRGDVHAAYAAYSLDNRPKVVAISGVDFTEPGKDEALRQHLLGIGEFTDIETTPSSAQVTFKDRKTAEKLFYGVANKHIPGVDGELEFTWVNKPLAHPTGTSPASSKDQQGAEEDEAMPDAEKGETAEKAKSQDTRRGSSSARDRRVDMDYEVADEDEGEWGIA